MVVFDIFDGQKQIAVFDLGGTNGWMVDKVYRFKLVSYRPQSMEFRNLWLGVSDVRLGAIVIKKL